MCASSARLPSQNVTADPPDHQGHRRLLLPYFSPRNVADLEDALRTYCRELIAAIGGPMPPSSTPSTFPSTASAC